MRLNEIPLQFTPPGDAHFKPTLNLMRSNESDDGGRGGKREEEPVSINWPIGEVDSSQGRIGQSARLNRVKVELAGELKKSGLPWKRGGGRGRLP